MEKLKELRLKRKLTQEKLATILGIARTTYTQYETGASEPDFKMLKKIAEFFDVTTDYLLDNNRSSNELDEFQFAMYGETQDLTDDQKQDILKFIRFVKSQEQEKKG